MDQGSSSKSWLTLENVAARRPLTGIEPGKPVWSTDGRWLAFLWARDGRCCREAWVVKKDGTGLRQLSPCGGGRADVSSGQGGATDIVWVPGTDILVLLREGAIWETHVSSGEARLLARACQPAWPGSLRSELGVSPDGAMISFLQDGDLWLLHRDSVQLMRATTVGQPPVGVIPLGTYYRPDVEIGPATWGAPPSYLWSPDGRYIAVHHVDRRHVHTMSFPYYLGEEPVMNVLRRSRPGETNEARTIGIYAVTTGSLHMLDLPATTDMRVVSFAWSPSGVLLVDRESDDAIDRRLYLFYPQTNRVIEVWHCHRETRVYNDIASGWHGDGRSILLSADLEDRYRLYVFTPKSLNDLGSENELPSFSADILRCEGSVRAVSPDFCDVTGPGIPVPNTSDILFVSNEPSPHERHVWRTDDQGRHRIRLTTRPGCHQPFLSPDGSVLALLSTDDVTPLTLCLTSAESPTDPVCVTTVPSLSELSRTWRPARYVSIPHRSDRFSVHVRILEPPALDHTKRHPVIFGPMYSNTVRNRWDQRFGALQQYLVLVRGYIVVQVDVRGSTGYGRDFREAFLMDWGGGDLDDIERAVEYVKGLPYVDPDRLGIWGTSYGGTLTIYMLLKKPGLFRAGVAAAPAVDPYYFGSDDVAICRRPSTHPHAFTRGAAQYAGNLQDHLLIIHGMQDDVVPFQTTVALAEELIRLGKDFEIAFAPAATHAWSQREDYALFLMRRLVGHFDRYLRDRSE